MRFFTLSLCLLLTPLLHAQYELALLPPGERPFAADGRLLRSAQLGGLNTPQVSVADLSGDGTPELYVFDRTGDVHMALRSGLNGWEPDLSLVEDWPSVQAFSLLRDFNADGVPDLFAFSSIVGRPGVEVYAGSRAADGRVSFALVEFPGAAVNLVPYTLPSGNAEFILSPITDLPGIADVDGDGDLDILGFDASGSYIVFYENVSPAGASGDANLLQFTRSSACYGGMIESAFDGTITLADAAGECSAGFAPDPGTEHQLVALHPGSTTTPYDVDGDGDMDLLIGDVAAPTLSQVTNTPQNGEAYFTEVVYDWPASTTSVDLPSFPAAFVVDLQGDGNTEVLVAPSNPQFGEDRDVLWRYGTGDGSAGLSLLSTSFLTDGAVDLGTGAHPAWGDLTGDGIDDLLVGNDSYFVDGERVSELRLYAWDGEAYTQQVPSWLEALNRVVGGTLTDLVPVLADLDADGDLDLMLGNGEGSLNYARNLAAPGRAAEFEPLGSRSFFIEVGRQSAPAVADLNDDGLLDLLIGEANGNLNLYLNTGKADAPDFDATPTSESYGGIDVRVPGFTNARSVPAFDRKGALYVGSAQGRMLVYRTPAQADGDAELLTELSLGVGEELSPSFGTDSDSTVVAAVGNRRGGVQLFDQGRAVSTGSTALRPPWSVYPNPSRGNLTASGLPSTARLSVFSSLGQRVWTGEGTALPQNLPNGTYVVVAATSFGESLGSKRVVVIR